MGINIGTLSFIVMLISGGLWYYHKFIARTEENGKKLPELVNTIISMFPLAALVFLYFLISDLSLVSLLVTVLSGAVWLYDIFVLRSEKSDNSAPEFISYAKTVFPFALIAFLIFWLQDLPLLLFLAVVYTGLVWLIDSLFLKKRRTEEQPEHANIEYSRSFFPVLLIVFVIRSFVIEPFQIPSESMLPTLEVGDFIVVNKFTYGIRLPVIRTKVININDPQRGDVMVFFPPNKDQYYIKRIIGLPGDTISYRNKVLTVNSETFEQTFVGVDPDIDDRCGNSRQGAKNVLFMENIGGEDHQLRYCNNTLAGGGGELVVPPGHYFMMGDNRDNSSDSRVFGPVPEERIVGKAFARWMHWSDKTKSLPSFSRVGTL